MLPLVLFAGWLSLPLTVPTLQRWVQPVATLTYLTATVSFAVVLNNDGLLADISGIYRPNIYRPNMYRPKIDFARFWLILARGLVLGVPTGLERR